MKASDKDMYIAIDTSGEFASLAISQGSSIVTEANWRCGQNHTVQLLPALEFALRQQRLEMKETTGLVVAKGPGSYNGLRVGLSIAKGLAFSLNIPLVGINTLEAEAFQHADRGLAICPVYNAGRGEIAAGIYKKAGQQWRRVHVEHVTTLSELCLRIKEPTVFCGEYAYKIEAALRESLGELAIFPSAAAGVRRGAYLLELGAQRLEAHDFDDPATLQPLYLRAPAITPPKAPFMPPGPS
jgi:tRNA threonylcarbamoyl adenosine modification protein YeaZ